MNFFQPSFKRAGVEAARGRPCQQALPSAGHALPKAARGSQNTAAGVRPRCRAVGSLDQIRLLRQMRVRQQSIVDIVDQPVAAPSAPTVPPLEQFLAGLRIAWREGEARPTAIPVAKLKRGRRRPDPLVKVTEQLHAWFEAEPWHTGHQLLERLQAAHPGEYPDGLLRTVQRRVRSGGRGKRRRWCSAKWGGELAECQPRSRSRKRGYQVFKEPISPLREK